MQRMIFRAIWLFGGLMTMALAQAGNNVGTATIAGRITFKEQPQLGVTVTVFSVRNAPSTEPPLSTKTDADGRYRLTGLSAGQYSITPRAPAYVIPFDGATYRPGKVVTVGENEAVENIDFALIKGGVLSGTITDHTGRPVIGQEVRLTQFDAQDKPQSLRTGNFRMNYTDDRGAYRLYGLPAGRYRIGLGESAKDGSIMIGRPGGYYRLTYYPGVTEETEAKLIELTEGGEVLELDFKVRPPEKTYEAKGRVIDGNTNAPIVGVNVAHGAVRPEQSSIGAYGWTGDLTNANGEFGLRGLTPGRYAVFPVAETAKEYFSDPTIFEVTDSDVEGLEIKAYRGAVISGTAVIEGANDPAILQKLRFVTITASTDSKTLRAPGKTAQINPDGSFRLPGVRAGRVRLTTYASDNSPIMLTRIEREGLPLRDGLDVSGTEHLSGIKLVLIYGSGTIRGQMNVIGTLPPDTRLVVWANGPEQGMNRSATVDARGRFMIENLAPGEYALTVSQSVVTGNSITHTRPKPMQKITVGTGEAAVTLTLDLNAKKEGQQ
jgi:protocatechuate 3,4-dioxygenase beta subunit